MNENSVDVRSNEVFECMLCSSLLRITHPHFRSCVENAKQSWYSTHMCTLKLHTNTCELLSCPIFIAPSLLHVCRLHAYGYRWLSLSDVSSTNTITHHRQCIICAYTTYERVNTTPNNGNSSEKVYQSWS